MNGQVATHSKKELLLILISRRNMGKIIPFLSWILLLGINLTAIGSEIQESGYTPILKLNQYNGLSSPRVYNIKKDHKGFIWVATNNGINRYNGHSINTYTAEQSPNSLWDASVTLIHVTQEGSIFAGTHAGLNIYDPKTDTFERLYITANESRNPQIFSLYECKNGVLWIGTSEGIYSYNNQVFEKLETINLELQDEAHHLIFDHSGTLWIGTYSKGLYRYDFETKLASLYGASEETIAPAPSIKNIVEIIEGPRKNLWIATWGQGLWQISSDRQEWSHFVHDVNNTNSPNSNFIKSISFDASGKLWIGYEEAGLDSYSPHDNIFSQYYARITDTAKFEEPSVYSIHIDDESIMWLGFRTEGVHAVALFENPFRLYSYHDDPSYQVYCILESSKGILAGSTKALDLFNLSDGSVKRFQLPNNETPIALGRLNENEVIIATFNNNIFKLDLTTGIFKTIYQNKIDKEPVLSKIRLVQMYNDRLLVGSSNKLYSVNLNNPLFEPYIIVENWIHTIREGRGIEDLWLSAYNHSIFNLTPDSIREYIPKVDGNIKDFVKHQNDLFIGTELGFYRFNVETQATTKFTDIFPYKNIQVNAIEKDENTGIWVSSFESIIHYDRITGQIRSYDKTDRMPHVRFSDGASALLKDGRIAFGGQGGIMILNPLNFSPQKNSSLIEFTNLKIHNKTVVPGDKNSPLQNNISESASVTFKNHHNTITFEFGLLSYINQSKHRYQYRLDGLNKNWIDLGNQNHVTITNLRRGNYTLRIRASNHDHVWGPENQIGIEILPPHHLAWYAWLLYSLIVAAVVLFLMRIYKARVKIKNEIKSKEIKLKTLKRLVKQENKFHQMKIRFFTNISHELRTPLSLILAPLETFINSGVNPEREEMEIMHKNAERLNRLVSQVLDFRKIETGKLALELAQGDITAFCRQKAMLFTPMALKKNLKYNVKIQDLPTLAWFDGDKLEKIIYNLLSNAFKFTDNGSITFSFTTTLGNHGATDTSSAGERPYAIITISDTGKGITEEEAQFIFERFYSMTKSNGHMEESQPSGTGIGLSLTKELTEIHDGKITFSRANGEGSVFTVEIPLDLQPNEENIPLSVFREANHNQAPGNNKKSTNETSKTLKEKPVILVVEDNADLRHYIQKEFATQFIVFDAENGKEGLDIAMREIPDIIISDIIMPEMDGIAMCEAIRSNTTTCHIPLVVLSANESSASKLRSYKSGVDDYITKPFSPAILKLKVSNLLESRKQLQTKFIRDIQLEPKALAVTNADESFLTKAMKIVEENLSDENFSADDFADKMAFSRVHLYRKLKSLTGESVTDFVKTIRLKLAADLIKNKKITVKETAYMVGFSDPKYFSKCFKQQFGMKPTEYAEA